MRLGVVVVLALVLLGFLSLPVRGLDTIMISPCGGEAIAFREVPSVWFPGCVGEASMLCAKRLGASGLTLTETATLRADRRTGGGNVAIGLKSTSSCEYGSGESAIDSIVAIDSTVVNVSTVAIESTAPIESTVDSIVDSTGWAVGNSALGVSISVGDSISGSSGSMGMDGVGCGSTSIAACNARLRWLRRSMGTDGVNSSTSSSETACFNAARLAAASLVVDEILRRFAGGVFARFFRRFFSEIGDSFATACVATGVGILDAVFPIAASVMRGAVNFAGIV